MFKHNRQLMTIAIISLLLISAIIALWPKTKIGDLNSSQATANQNAEQIDYNSPFGLHATAVNVVDNMAYVGLGDRLVIYNISNYSEPEFVGKTEKLCTNVDGPECIINDIDSSGQLIYISISNWRPVASSSNSSESEEYSPHVVVFNVNNPNNPTIVGWVAIPGNSYDIAINNEMMFVASGKNGIRVYNISGGQNPQYIGSSPVDSAREISVYQNVVYVGAWGNMYAEDEPTPTPGSAMGSGGATRRHRIVLFQINGSSINGPLTEISSLDLDQAPTGIIVVQSYIYISVTNGMRSIDISNMQLPVQIGSIPSWNETSGIAGPIDNKVAILEHKISPFGPTKAVEIVDIENPGAPDILTDLSLVDGAFDGVISNNMMLIAAGDGLNIININNQNEVIVMAGSQQTRSWGSDILVDGDHLFVFDIYRGVMISDISNPSSPSLLSNINLWSQDRRANTKMDVMDHYLLVARENKVYIIDIANLGNPIVVGQPIQIDSSFSNDVTGITVYGNLALVSTTLSGMVIINCSDVNNANVVGNIRSREIDSVAIDSDNLFMAAIDGLAIYNLSNPSAPALISLSDPAAQSYVIKNNNYVFTVDAFRGFISYDVSNIASPNLVGVGVEEIGINDMALVNDTIIAVGDSGGLIEVNIQNPANLVVDRMSLIPGYGVAIYCDGDVCIVGRGDGISILDVSNVHAPVVLYDEVGPG